MASRKSLGVLTLDLVARTGGFAQGMDKAERQSKKWRKQVAKDLDTVGAGFKHLAQTSTAALAAGTAALTALTVSSMKSIDAQNKLARSLDATYDSVTALSFAFDEAGVDGYDNSLARLNRRLGAAESGTGEAAKTVEALNLNLEELSNLDADERVARIADAIQESGASAQEAARYAQQLGFEQKEAAQFFMQGGDAIRAYRKEVEEFGLALDTVDAIKVEQANDAFGRTSLLLDAVGQQMAVQVAPIVTAVSDLFVQSAKDAGSMEQAVEDGFNSIIEAAGFAADAVEGVNRVIDVTGSAVAIMGLQVKQILLTIYRDAVELPVEAANQIISAMNALPAIDLDPIALPGKDIRQDIALTKGAIKEGWADINETLMAPLPSTMFEKFVADAREKSGEAARLTEEANARIRAAMGAVEPTGYPAGEGGQDDQHEMLKQQFESASRSLLSPVELEQERYQERMEMFREYLSEGLASQAEVNEMIEREQRRHQEAMADIDQAKFDKQMEGASLVFSNLSTLMNTENKKLFEVGKTAAMAQAAVAGTEATIHSYNFGAELGGPALGAAFATTAAIATGAKIAQLGSLQFGGGASVPSGGIGTGGSAGTYQPAQPSIPSGPSTDEDEARPLNINFYGNVTGLDADQIARSIKDHLESTDFVLIESATRNGRILSGK